MRGVISKTPVRKQQQKVDKTRESSGKKMVQARLPFKVVTCSPTSPSGLREIETGNSNGESAKSKDITNKSLKTSSDDVIMMIDSDEEAMQIEPQIELSKSETTCSPKTPLSTNLSVGCSSASATKVGKQSSGTNTAKLQIKLKFSNKKRRKSKQSGDVTNKEDTVQVITESSDDTGDIVGELNPNKRPRVDETENGKDCDEKMSDSNNTDEEEGEVTIALTSDSEDSNSASNGEEEDSSEPVRTCLESTQNSSSESNSIQSEIAQDLLLEIIEKSLEEAFKDEPTVNESSPAPTHKTHLPPAGPSSDKHHHEKLTLKQQMLKEKRRKLREIKEQKLREEKIQKQREKLEKEQIRRRERDEKEEQKRKEREEKEEQKRKEREEKERKRLAEIETKNEEKRKRNEAKEEEQRRKDEERRRKEQEKVEAENKKKKAAEAFTKFFVPKTTRIDGVGEANIRKDAVACGDGSGACVGTLAFRPFQIKGDMKLAPIRRKIFTSEARESFDSLICAEKRNASQQDDKTIFELYLNELKTGKIIPVKWKRILNDAKDQDEDDVILVDELECAAQTIVEDTVRPIERYRAKFYKFYENRRPPYFGTWRKKTNVITPRRPLALDKSYFDYEVDSDLEWEEEEPGESLDGSDDDKEKESEDDDYEVDNEWFVPHGHLSEEELQNDDDNEGAGENNREVQKAKLEMLQQEFAEEMKRKTEKLKPRLIGCIWQDQNGNKPEPCPAIIWENLNKHAMLYNGPPLLEPSTGETMGEGCEESTGANATSAGEKLKPISLTKSMLKDLIRIIHGNRHKKIFLINEFIAFIEKTEEAIKNGDVCGPPKSVVRDKFDEFATWQAIDLNSINGRKKNKKKLCWIVSENVLKEYDLEDLGLHNKWSYTLEPKHVDVPSNTEKTLGNKTVLKDLLKGEMANKGNIKQSLASSPREGINTNDSEDMKMSSTEERGEKLDTIADDSVADKTINKSPASVGAVKAVVKKRVPLLMSTARGQDIPTAEKNALISKFLIKSKQEKNNAKTEKTVQDTEVPIETVPLEIEPLETVAGVTTESVPMEVDGVVILD